MWPSDATKHSACPGLPMGLEGQGSEWKPFGKETGLTLTHSFPGLFCIEFISKTTRYFSQYTWELGNGTGEMEIESLLYGKEEKRKARDVITCRRSKSFFTLAYVLGARLLKTWRKADDKDSRDSGLEDSLTSLCLSHPWGTSYYNAWEDYTAECHQPGC